MFREIRHFFRLFAIARTLARYNALFPLDLIAPSPLLHRALKALTLFSRRQGDPDKTPGQRLAQALHSLGPSFIKLGQIMATRPDIIGEEVANDLTSLQDRVPPFATDEAKAIIEKEFNMPVDALFAEFSEESIAFLARRQRRKELRGRRRAHVHLGAALVEKGHPRAMWSIRPKG